MRADRLVAALLVLQARGQVTAAELAGELEVSVPTARRDLEALSAAGIPVYAQPGRGGGWRLVGGARTDLSGLTAGEAKALFMLLGSSTAYDDQTQSALRKLLAALPATFRNDASTAAHSLIIDRSGWGERERALPPGVDLLRDAVIERRRLILEYDGPNGSSQRTVEPWGLVDKDEQWYLVAGTAAGRRTFRLDRIRNARPTAETFEPPPDLDLGALWDEVVDTIETRRGQAIATVTVQPEAVGRVRRQFGRQAQLTQDTDGRWSGTVAAGTIDILARMLAPFAGAVAVLEPEVRARMVEIGRAIIAANQH